MAYCSKCGNSGMLLDNTPCSCDLGRGDLNDGLACMTIPEQYRGVVFDSLLLPNDLGDYYKKFMQDLYFDVTSMKYRNKNLFIGSPAKHGKTILAYSCIQSLFRRDIPTFPLFDVLELRSMLIDMDRGRKPAYLEGVDAEPINMLASPILFVRVPSETGYNVYDTIYNLVDRRVRRGNSTIFLHNGSWKFFAENDKKDTVSALAGDGSFCTIDNKSFWNGGDSK
jgi:hypothetical protein